MAQKILIVDDDLDTLKLVGTTLERQGYEITAAPDGMKALEAVEKEKPDLILLDIMMPGMDGYEVTRILREKPDTANIPIIMFTAKAQVDDKVEGLDAGADDYLTKPTHPSELVARVRAMLKRPKPRAPVLAPSPQERQSVGLIAPKGGMGITTLAINLAVALSQKARNGVVVGEMRPGRGDISIFLGYDSSQALTELLGKAPADIKREDVENALVTHRSGVRFLLASYEAQDAQLNSAAEQMEVIYTHLADIGTYTVLDLGASLTLGNQRLLKHCDHVIVAVESTPYSVQQTKSLIASLINMGIKNSKITPVLLNRTRMEQALSINDVRKLLGTELASVFTPAPELAHQAAVAQKPMVLVDAESYIHQQVNKLIEALFRLGEAESA